MRLYSDARVSGAIRVLVLIAIFAHVVLLLRSASQASCEIAARTHHDDNLPTTASSRRHLNSSESPELTLDDNGRRITLAELIATDPNPTCRPGNSNKTLIDSIVLEEDLTYFKNRKIPKIIHMTSKTRCMTPAFIRNINLWKFAGYSLYIHDDAAVDRLLAKYWPEFPHLQHFQKCSLSGAAKADIWRYLVLWEYGGIYTDIDNAPGKKLYNGTAILDTDDAWFVVEKAGVMSQYFMASSPKHPFMFIALSHCLERLSQVKKIGKQFVPYVTGPGTTKSAMMLFMKNESFATVKNGYYVGIDGRSITVKGGKGLSHVFVRREKVAGIDKVGGFVAMGMKHYSRDVNDTFTDSCYEHLYKEAVKDSIPK